MSKLDKLDKVLGEALEQLVVAAQTLSECDDIDDKQYLTNIGGAVAKIWDIRDSIYQNHPNLKPDFVSESDENQISFEKQDKLSREAEEYELNGDFIAATDSYKQLLACSTIGHFKRIAEAGLFRVCNES